MQVFCQHMVLIFCCISYFVFDQLCNGFGGVCLVMYVLYVWQCTFFSGGSGGTDRDNGGFSICKFFALLSSKKDEIFSIYIISCNNYPNIFYIQI